MLLRKIYRHCYCRPVHDLQGWLCCGSSYSSPMQRVRKKLYFTNLHNMIWSCLIYIEGTYEQICYTHFLFYSGTEETPPPTLSGNVHTFFMVPLLIRVRNKDKSGKYILHLYNVYSRNSRSFWPQAMIVISLLLLVALLHAF